jgi:hypothetical protein
MKYGVSFRKSGFCHFLSCLLIRALVLNNSSHELPAAPQVKQDFEAIKITKYMEQT